MPFKIIREDITKMSCDAIVNAANYTLLGGGGVDGAIHKAAGIELLKECQLLGGCCSGDAKITKGYNLPCRYVIHAVGPVYEDGFHHEYELLRSCYKRCLEIAVDYKIESIAFPLISSGTNGFKKEDVLNIALNVISEFLLTHDMMVYIVVYDQESFDVSHKLFYDIQCFIDDAYIDENYIHRSNSIRLAPSKSKLSTFESSKASFEDECYAPECMHIDEDLSLEEFLNYKDESFADMLFRKIDESGMSDSECYKRANIDRKLFSKIRSQKNYKPSKMTAIAFAIALEMDLGETKEFLSKAGYALSRSYKADIIIEYFIIHHNYNIYDINEALFAFDQPLL